MSDETETDDGDRRVVGTVGLPGSGKGEAAAVAERADIPVVTMGDVVRKETEERGLPPEEHGTVARALRAEDGPEAIARRSIPMIERHLETSDTVVVDGLRSGVELDCFEEAFGDDFTLVSIEAPFETRATRLAERGRDLTDEDREALLAREQRELDFGMDEAMARADVVIENTTSLAAYRERIRTVLDVESESAEGDATETEAGAEVSDR
ncbi:AAA family ATPase [Salinigranum salinum]|uniref:AAA family ATPase n=1 Tax=Salinigranum salinum TaxID=1364937 RepID=UPI0012610DD2|nr:AAA family ATPase [Salinigranum salinum]